MMPVKNCFLYQDLVSVIPCLAKADSFTSEEIADLKLDVSINEQKCRLSLCLKELIFCVPDKAAAEAEQDSFLQLFKCRNYLKTPIFPDWIQHRGNN